MKKSIYVLILWLLLGLTSTAQVKIGLPAGAPALSAILDLSNTGDGTRAFMLPQVLNTAAILLPVQGMLIYDISSKCIRAFGNGTWSNCLRQPTTSIPSMIVNGDSSSINGYYSKDSLLKAVNTVRIRIVNNSFSAATVNTAVGDITLSGVGAAGMTVASVSTSAVYPAPNGGFVNIWYTLSGTPTTPGSFTATYKKLSLTCAKTGVVCIGVTPVAITHISSPSQLASPIAEGSTINFTADGGINTSGMSWVMTSSPATGIFTNAASGTGTTAQAVLTAGSAGTVTVVFSATYTCGIIVTGTQTAAVLDLQANCTTSTLNGIYTQNRALTASNTITMVIKNNTYSAQSFTPVAGNITLSDPAAAGMSVASVSPSTATSIAAGGTLNVVYTLNGTPTTEGNFTATFTSGPLNPCVKTGTVCLDIPLSVINTNSPATLPNPIVAGNKITFDAAGNTPGTPITWTMTSNPTTGIFSNTTTTGTGTQVIANLIAGANGYVTVTFTATNACGLVVSKTVTVIMGDNLRAALVAAAGSGTCSSCITYDAASDNTWVQITKAEYDKIDVFMPVTKAAGSDAFINLSSTGPYITNTTVTNVPNSYFSNLPPNNFVVAFSVKNATNASATSNSYLKYSLSQNSGFSMSGPILKIPGGTGIIYNIMKKPSNVVDALNENFIGIYLPNLGVSRAGSVTSYNGTGNIANPATSNVNGIQFQIKGTTSKRW